MVTYLSEMVGVVRQVQAHWHLGFYSYMIAKSGLGSSATQVAELLT